MIRVAWALSRRCIAHSAPRTSSKLTWTRGVKWSFDRTGRAITSDIRVCLLPMGPFIHVSRRNQQSNQPRKSRSTLYATAAAAAEAMCHSTAAVRPRHENGSHEEPRFVCSRHNTHIHTYSMCRERERHFKRWFQTADVGCGSCTPNHAARATNNSTPPLLKWVRPQERSPTHDRREDRDRRREKQLARIERRLPPSLPPSVSLWTSFSSATLAVHPSIHPSIR